MEEVSSIFHEDCQDACISVQTSPQGAPTPHISPSPCGKKGVIGRKGLTLRANKKKKRAKSYYQRGALAGVQSEDVLIHPSLAKARMWPS